MADLVLKVRMLGGFTLTYGDSDLSLEQNRNSKVIYLLQYLLYYHDKTISQEALTELLCSDETITNPANMLKNIVYRLRKLLASSELPEKEYIIYRRGAYGWNREIPVEIDCEQFEQALTAAGAPERAPDERVALYERAIDLYSGDFLPRISYRDWAAPMTVRYQEEFLQAVSGVCTLLSERGEYLKLLDICTRASSIYPYDEDIHVMRITCLFELHRMKEALAAYDETTTMLFDELGIGPSPAMSALYREMTDGLQRPTDSVTEIRAELSEPEREAGAYYCNYQAFVDSYRFMVRCMERSGQSVFLMLCSITDIERQPLDSGQRLTDATAALNDAVWKSLRRGDLYTRCSPTQYLLLLVGINQENCAIVSGRISKRFREFYNGRGVRLHYKVVSAAQIGDEMRELQAGKEAAAGAGTDATW